jgi:hypothetical protein
MHYLKLQRKNEFINIMNAAEGTWYVCPNGHPYSVGECGRPMESIPCPTCGARIGGHDHVPDSGNVRFDADSISNVNIRI